MIPRLCYITDVERGTAGRPLEWVIREAAAGGLDMVMLRDRGAPVEVWRRLCDALSAERRKGLRVVVSRRLDVARALRLDGVHLAADALPVGLARAWLGNEALLGYSAHSAEEALDAERAGASYVTLSPIYATGSKPGASGRGIDWLGKATCRTSLPVLALGGVTPPRAPSVLAAGAWGIAAIEAIGAASDVRGAAEAFRTAFGGQE